MEILSVIGFSETEFLILVFLLFGEFITVAEVASITESWNNVGLFVEDGVNRCNPECNIVGGEEFFETLHAFFATNHCADV